MRFNHTTPFSEIQACVLDHVHTHKPDYATWSPLRQEAWRASRTIDPLLKDAILADSVADVFDLPIDTVRQHLHKHHELDKLVTAPGTTVVNAMLLALDGIGRDHIYLNESLGTHTLLDFHTVGAWDRHEHAYQNAARAQHNQTAPSDQHTNPPTPYQGYLYAIWGRAVVNGTFAYLTLSTLAGYITSTLDSTATDFINNATPHQFDSNPDHGTKTSHGILWSKHVNAYGKEVLYEALTAASRDYMQTRDRTLAQRYVDQAATTTWVQPRAGEWDLPWEHNYEVVFSDPTVLDKVRWSDFMADTRTFAGDPDWLAKEVAAEVGLFTAHLQAIVDAHPQGKGA